MEVLARPRIGALALVLAALATATALAPAAAAGKQPHVESSLRADGTTIVRYVAPAGQHNELEMRVRAEGLDPYKRQYGILEDTGIDFYDIGADSITAQGPLCKPQGTGVGCDVRGTRVEIQVELGDGDDELDPVYDPRRRTRALVSGGSGNDVLQDFGSTPTAIDFRGGAGIDAVNYYDRTLKPFAFSDDDVFNDGLGHDRIHGDVELWVGGDGPDRFTFTGSGRHVVFGTGGDDTMVSGPGRDEFDGGYGGDPGVTDARSSDTVSYAGREDGVRVTLDGLADDGAPGEGDYILPTVEHVIGTDQADTLVGPAQAPDKRAYELDGGGGNDVLSGGAGTDLADGGPGDDVVIVRGGGKDAAKCGDGTDVAVADQDDLFRKASPDCERIMHSYLSAPSSQTGERVTGTVAVAVPGSQVSAALYAGERKVGSHSQKLRAGLLPIAVGLNDDGKKKLRAAQNALPLELRVKISAQGRKAVSAAKTVTLARR